MCSRNVGLRIRTSVTVVMVVMVVTLFLTGRVLISLYAVLVRCLSLRLRCRRKNRTIDMHRKTNQRSHKGAYGMSW